MMILPHCLLLIITSHIIVCAHGLGLVTQILTRSVELVAPSRITAGVTTTLQLTGSHLSSTDRIGIFAEKTCTTLLTTAGTTLTVTSSETVANVIVRHSTVGGDDGSNGNYPDSTTSGYICLQVDGTTTDDAASTYLDTGATIFIDTNPTINMVTVLHASPANWAVAPGASLTLNVGVAGSGLLSGVSTRLSLTESCGLANKEAYASSSVLENVTDDATYATTSFVVTADKLALVRTPLGTGGGLILAKNLTHVDWINNLVLRNSSGWTFCYNAKNFETTDDRRRLTTSKHMLPPQFSDPTLLAYEVLSASLSGVVQMTSISVVESAGASTHVLLTLSYDAALVRY